MIKNCPVPICPSCKYISEKENEQGKICCKAFPEGIPFEFLYGSKALPGKICNDKFGFEEIEDGS